VPHATLHTERLVLVPITVGVVEACLAGDRARAEALVGARLPEAWPGRALVERAFSARLEAVQADPEVRLWGDRVMLTRATPHRVLGSVVFHGAPGPDGVVEVAYGVEEESQRKGYATEGTGACVEWALRQPGVRAVRATTPSWHASSQRVLIKCGFAQIGSRESDAMVGDLLEFERVG
jgi:RimJ/RimL family protein N-acetyltransferase